MVQCCYWRGRMMEGIQRVIDMLYKGLFVEISGMTIIILLAVSLLYFLFAWVLYFISWLSSLLFGWLTDKQCRSHPVLWLVNSIGHDKVVSDKGAYSVFECYLGITLMFLWLIYTFTPLFWFVIISVTSAFLLRALIRYLRKRGMFDD